MTSISQDVISRVVSEFIGLDELYKRGLGSTFYQVYLDYTQGHPSEMLETVVELSMNPDRQSSPLLL